MGELRYLGAERVADARCRIYASELRIRVDSFERWLREAGVAADDRMVEVLEEFLFDVRAVFDRMAGVEVAPQSFDAHRERDDAA